MAHLRQKLMILKKGVRELAAEESQAVEILLAVGRMM